MNSEPERRKHPRMPHPDLPVAIIHPESRPGGGKGRPRKDLDTVFVNVVDSSEGGVLLSSFIPLEVGSAFEMVFPVSGQKAWRSATCRVVSVRGKEEMPGQSLVGVRFEIPGKAGRNRPVRRKRGGRGMDPEDLEFLLGTPLVDYISQEARCPLLSHLSRKRVRAGKRLMAQGEQGDSLFIIRRGTCLVSIEKEGLLHPVTRLQPGEIVGEMAILTGEPRFAHVDAETDMELWGISRKDFDPLCERHTELRNFLTGLITRRFSSEGFTPDRTVGRYVIHDMIGKGGWSFVYRGFHSSLNMPVAVKMLKHDMAMNADFLKRFRDEAKIIARLNHDNIVKVYDIEELFRTIFVVMEYVDGVPLSHILKKMVRLPPPAALGILLDACAGLSYAHRQGIIHQDIKPANLFVQPNNRVKIMDFGLACAPGTARPALQGTFFYMSPEQVRGEPVDERSDIYSLGITAFEMITGRRPFPRGSVVEALSSQLDQDIPDPGGLVPDLPIEMRDFLLRSTSKKKMERYRSVEEILGELEPLADRMGVQAGPWTQEQRKMMSLFLFYSEEHQLTLKRLVEEFGNELKAIGADLRAAEFKDLS
ncbi:MAG: protein kinase [Deltaproteobacteria bacterium]|nr:protein kinase [Deltaproteobacteria bacterium]